MINATTKHPELIDKLTEGISQLTSSDKWQSYLEFQSRFHHYSFNNVLLISAQANNATQVAGFNAWKKLGRNVSKGEKAIWILAPMIYKVADNSNLDEETQVIRGFKFVPVFDASQTEGEELPSVCNRLIGDDPANCYESLVKVANSYGFSVEDFAFSGSTNGDCTFELHRIRVEVNNTPAQRIKTLVHELAHAILHSGEANRLLAELEAESVAYIVCQVLGIDSSDYSFGYVATWAGDGEQAIDLIKASCERIQKAAENILQLSDMNKTQHYSAA